MRIRNRLVLVGNGYDLAAGLKTSYEDFLVDFFKGCLFKAIKDGNYKDQLITIDIKVAFFHAINLREADFLSPKDNRFFAISMFFALINSLVISVNTLAA